MMSNFPETSGENLLREKIDIPSELRGKFNIVVVAFQQWHQKLVNTWVPFLDELVSNNPDIDYYELPTIRRMNFIYRSIVNNGMRAGIPSKETRRRTITLYIDKKPFTEQLGIEEDDIYLFLIDKEGHMFWRESGIIDQEKANSLLATISELEI